MNNSLSIFARALATENLSFAFDPNAETASFDVKNRHLTLPVWDVSETVQTMLIAHEISHALWTPYQQSEDILAAAEKEGFNKMILQRIANVVEDVRIEKLMKQKYPGTRRDFFLGYKEIVDADLFKFSEMDFNKASMLTRMNFHFKWGVPGFLPINLSAEEREIADMIDRVETFEQVYDVAKILYEHPSMQSIRQEVESQMEGQNGKGDGAEALDAVSTDLFGGSFGKKDGEVYNASTVTVSPVSNINKMIVSTSTILSHYEKDNEGRFLNLDDYRQFVKDSDSFVRQLAMQFDRRKAADEIRRERPKQTGMLNLDRLHQYRTHDDLFISKIVKQDGKNHGIVFLLDFSGSMGHRIGDCLLQLFQLVWFCEKVKIPFEVFAFTDIHPASVIGHDEYRKQYDAWVRKNGTDNNFIPDSIEVQTINEKPTSIVYGHCRLLNLASSRDDASKRERLLAYLYDSFIKDSATMCKPSCLSLHGTPTVEAVAAASQFIKGWVVEQNIQIPTFMLVTDGQPNGIYTKNECMSRVSYYHSEMGMLTVMNETYGTAHRMNLSDYRAVPISNVLIASMLDSMRQKVNARIVGMFVGGNTLNFGEFSAFCLSSKEREEYFNLGYHQRSSAESSPRFAAMRDAYKEGAIIVHPEMAPGFDSFFLIKTPKIVKDADAIVESGTFTKIKNTFVKTMGKRAGSRVFLTRYVDIVAGQKIKPGLPPEYNHPGLGPYEK